MEITKNRPIAIKPTLPAEQASLLSHGLDYYKPTMSQLAYDREPNVEVTFRFRNRGQQRIMDHVEPDELQEHLNDSSARRWTAPELEHLGGITINGGEPASQPGYLDYLATHQLPEVHVRHDKEIDDIAIETTGPWPLVTFRETQVMTDVSETYFRNYMTDNDIDPTVVYQEGDKRLSDFIGTLQDNPDIKISDFGTRRRFSLNWHRHVLDRLITECPDSLTGTSNVGLAAEFGIKEIGTFAHELPMVYAGLADASSGGDSQAIRTSHNRLLRDWYAKYGEEYSIALTDTFGTDFFFRDFTPDQAAAWRGVRQDSGDPYAFGEKLVKFYQAHDIDPATKVSVFSDALDGDKIVRLHGQFRDRLRDPYGIGTKLTNNLGLRALNMVMKASHVYDPSTGRGADTVKLSDDAGKHTGPAKKIAKYQTIFG